MYAIYQKLKSILESILFLKNIQASLLQYSQLTGSQGCIA